MLQSNDIVGIGDNAWNEKFMYANITQLSLPNLTTVEKYGLYSGFNNNSHLTSINLPSLTTVKGDGMENAFNDCSNLTGNIDLSSLTTIEGNGLYGCFYGTSITSCDLSKLVNVDGAALGAAFQNSSIRTLDLSGMVNMRNRNGGWGNCDYMCYSCSNLTTVDFSNLEVALSFNYAFGKCTSLVEIDFPKLTTVGHPDEEWGGLFAGVFQNDTSLRIVRFPKLSYINNSTAQTDNWSYAFYGCTSLETVDFSAATAIPPLGWDTNDYNAMPFRNTNSTFKILVPNGLYDQWCAADGWSDADIRPHLERATKGTVFVANEPGTIALVKNVPSSQATADLEYSTDLGATWSTYTVGTSLTFNARLDQIWFRAGTTGNPNGLSAFHFTGTGTWICSSDLGYLLSRNGIAASTQIPQNCFSGLFNNCTSLIGVSSDALPFTSLSSGCYVSMFEGCTNLYTNAPDLPAVNVPDLAYRYMFKGCSRLATPPAVEGTTFGTQSC